MVCALAFYFLCTMRFKTLDLADVVNQGGGSDKGFKEYIFKALIKKERGGIGMSLGKKRGYINTILAMGLALIFICGCAKSVKQKQTSSLPGVEALEQRQKPPEDAVELEDLPARMKVEDIEASIEKKKYPGIEGEFMESPELKDCHFEFDKYNLTDEARMILVRNAEILHRLPGCKIQIEGHCDERGTKEYNLALGERRASSVKDYLVFLGISEEYISTISYGEEMPVDPGHDEKAWAKNRRAHFIILSKP